MSTPDRIAKFASRFALIVSCPTLIAGAVFASGPETQQNPVAVPYQLQTPTRGVTLTGGVFKQVFDKNIEFLLTNFSEDDLLYVFRQRAGQQNPPGKPHDWDIGNSGPTVPGSVAGVFLMGSGNALRWVENPQLRARINAVIAGISACKEPNGFIMAYAEKETPVHENANYVRSWITHGLIDAAAAGNSEALPLIRGYLDWFNHCEYLSQVVDNKHGYSPGHYIPYQGMISSTLMYLSALGRQDDLEVVRRYYQENWWLEQLLAKDDRAIYDRPEAHCYEITALEAYLDLYHITGEMKYLQAVLNAWEMLHNEWEMPGGSWALCEAQRYPPKSYLLGITSRSGELCGTVFWIKLNQRLHMLFPDNEVFVNEIEKSIYNAAIGNQLKDGGICYHAVLDGKKDEPTKPPQGTCCEGQGTRLFASLPEYLYSLSTRGLCVDLYASSEITWKQGATAVTLSTVTAMPEEGAVTLKLTAAQPVKFRLSIRIPSWATHSVEIRCNANACGMGIPGSYYHLEREWKTGDEVSLTLPMAFRIERYEGYDKYPGFPRYALEYGSLLLGLTGNNNFQNTMRILNDPMKPADWLKPVEGRPVHFQISTDQGPWRLRNDGAWSPNAFEYMPYYEIPAGQEFTVFPVIQGPNEK